MKREDIKFSANFGRVIVVSVDMAGGKEKSGGAHGNGGAMATQTHSTKRGASTVEAKVSASSIWLQNGDCNCILWVEWDGTGGVRGGWSGLGGSVGWCSRTPLRRAWRREIGCVCKMHFLTQLRWRWRRRCSARCKCTGTESRYTLTLGENGVA